jgi:hypothetical protein
MRLHSVRGTHAFVALLLSAVALAACDPGALFPVGCCTHGPTNPPEASGGPAPTTAGGPPPSASSSPAAAKTGGELRVALIHQVGEPWFCDPDEYPVAREERQRALERFGEVQADREDYVAAAAALGIDPAAELSDEAKFAVYHLWKLMQAIELAPDGARYRFEYLVHAQADQSQGRLTGGTITDTGEIHVDSEVPAGAPNCPICLARGTRIATPAGDVPVDDIAVGDAVWSFDATGRRVSTVVLDVGSTAVPRNHQVVRLRLADGRELRASSGHPLADGRLLGTITVGDLVDGSAVVSADLEAYLDQRTFDLLADGPTGGYFANGIPLLSTLGR